MSNFLTAEWRKLVMFNYAIDPAILQPLVPPHTQLDFWNNTCYISLVGFMFKNTRVKGIKIPFHINFEEINLRFYVKYNDPEMGVKRGVVFINEIVPKRMISFVANTLYREHYLTLPMRHTEKLENNLLHIGYGLKKNKEWFDVNVIAKNNPEELVENSETEFITEHFWGYAKWNNQSTNEYEVGHPRWNTYTVIEHTTNFDFGLIYGNQFSFLNSSKPISVYLAEGSEIFVNKGKVIS